MLCSESWLCRLLAKGPYPRPPLSRTVESRKVRYLLKGCFTRTKVISGCRSHPVPREDADQSSALSLWENQGVLPARL